MGAVVCGCVCPWLYVCPSVCGCHYTVLRVCMRIHVHACVCVVVRDCVCGVSGVSGVSMSKCVVASCVWLQWGCVWLCGGGCV